MPSSNGWPEGILKRCCSCKQYRLGEWEVGVLKFKSLVIFSGDSPVADLLGAAESRGFEESSYRTYQLVPGIIRIGLIYPTLHC